MPSPPSSEELTVTEIVVPSQARVEETAADLTKMVEDVSEEVPEEAVAEVSAGTQGDSGPMPSTESGLRGVVVDSSGKGVSNVKIDLFDPSTGEVLRTLDAGVDGIFVAQGLGAGHYALSVQAASVPLGISAPLGALVCRGGSEPAGYGSVCVEVANLGEPATAEIVLPLSSGIQGTVYGRTGQAEADVRVRAVSKVPGFTDHSVSALTDAKGFFFLSLVPGPYELQMLLPGEDNSSGHAHSMDVIAKPGSALLLETVDFSKIVLDQKNSGAEPPVLEEHETRSSVPVEPMFQKVEIKLGGKTPPGGGPGPVVGETGTVELRGRIISKWGESLPAMGVLAEKPDGTVVEMTQTNDLGNYVLESVPVGNVIVRVGRDLEINRAGPRGTTLLKRPEPLDVRTFSGQKRVTLEDVVVDVRRIYRLSGKITIGDEAFQEFKKTIRPTKRGQDFLTEQQYRRAYFRGLRLVQNNRGEAKGGTRPTTVRGQSVPIAPDGTFTWSCTLPADDIVLVLESRSGRERGGYRGPVGIPVTPAGVRPATIEITYPTAAKEKKPGDRDSKPTGGETGVDPEVSPSVEVSAPAATGPTSSTH